jgi:hypothetical protein
LQHAVCVSTTVSEEVGLPEIPEDIVCGSIANEGQRFDDPSTIIRALAG